MRRACLAIVVTACHAGTQPTYATAPEPAATPEADAALPWCQLMPAWGSDNLRELRALPAEVAAGNCRLPDPHPIVDWLAQPGHMAITDGSPTLDQMIVPIAVRDEADARVVVVRGSDEVEVCGTADAPIDLDSPKPMPWIAIDATDRPLRLERVYPAGTCTARRFVDRGIAFTTVDLGAGDGATPVIAVSGTSEDVTSYQRRGDVLVVNAPYDDDTGGCIGEGPPPEGWPSSESSGPRGFVATRILVPGVADQVVVRTVHLPPPPPCE